MQFLLVKNGTCEYDIIVMAEFLYQVLSVFIAHIPDHEEF